MGRLRFGRSVCLFPLGIHYSMYHSLNTDFFRLVQPMPKKKKKKRVQNQVVRSRPFRHHDARVDEKRIRLTFVQLMPGEG